jgi:HSP20 family protein
MLLHHSIKSPGYPGQYIPLPETEKLMEEMLQEGVVINTPPVNMDEYETYYKIEMVIPGVRREDLLIYVLNNVLSVAAAHRTKTAAAAKSPIHEFDRKCFERRITVPDDAAAEFLNAAFREGLLRIYIPKSLNSAPVVFRQVVVY